MTPQTPSLRRPFFLLAAALALPLLAAPVRAAGRKPPEVRFVIEPSTVTAGRTLMVRADSSIPLRNAALYFKEKKAVFYPLSEKRWRALLGVNSMEAPGEKSALFYAEYRKGKVHQATVTFTVEGGTYPVSRIPLTKEKDSIISSGQLGKDNKVLEAVYAPKTILDKKLWSGYFVTPTTGVVSSVFGARRAYGDRPAHSAHSGLDIANDAGTMISAPNRGRVVHAGWLDSFGNVIVLDHGQGVFTYYLHMQKLLAEKGALVETGDPLGLMGAEGLATGPHLHWTFVVSGEKVNPVEWTEREFE